MVKCPSCGAEETIALKRWPVTFKKQGENYRKPKFFIGIFRCTKCKTKFRSRIESLVKPAEVKQTEIPKLEDLVEKVRSIHSDLIQTNNALHEKLSGLETERGYLTLELADLQRDAEFRAEALEDEICQLRAEIKSLKELLDSTVENK